MPPKMNQDFLTKLPSEIITNILSRLPIPTILLSKCVCKPWLHLLETDEFANSHLAKSVPCLVVLTPKSETGSSSSETDSSSCAIFEFEDEQDLDHHDLHYNQLTKFDFPHTTEIEGSASGLLFLSKLNDKSEAHYVCNPITRNYVEVRCPKELIRPYPKVVNYPEILAESVYAYPQSVTYGFGLSKITGEYKVVRIYHDSVITRELHGGTERTIPESECHVHTLGTESWRRVAPCSLLEYPACISRVFLNGCLHWIVSDSDTNLWISCFDLETECFSTFSIPPVNQGSFVVMGCLSALDGCLCFCDHTWEDETIIWLMKEYGVEKSWSKEYVININYDLDIEGWESVYPIKVFKDGDILMLREDRQLFHYSNKTQTAQEIGFFTVNMINSILLTPSFVSLKSLGMENVISF